jgi:hypothetical protein
MDCMIGIPLEARTKTFVFTAEPRRALGPPASYTAGTWATISRGDRPRRIKLTTHHHLVKRKLVRVLHYMYTEGV